jgi:hypothetical protein
MNWDLHRWCLAFCSYRITNFIRLGKFYNVDIWPKLWAKKVKNRQPYYNTRILAYSIWANYSTIFDQFLIERYPGTQKTLTIIFTLIHNNPGFGYVLKIRYFWANIGVATLRALMGAGRWGVRNPPRILVPYTLVITALLYWLNASSKTSLANEFNCPPTHLLLFSRTQFWQKPLKTIRNKKKNLWVSLDPAAHESNLPLHIAILGLYLLLRTENKGSIRGQRSNFRISSILICIAIPWLIWTRNRLVMVSELQNDYFRK